jgi:peptidoglycan/LPS O-acetylase OafA/YrhL
VRSDGRNPAFWQFVSNAIWGFDPGPTWFLEALLVFSAVYALWRLRPRSAERPAAAGRRELRGANIVAVGAAIAIASFAVRLAFPLGSDQFHLQLSVFAQYAVLFAFGALAARRRWLEGISPSLARRCGLAALAAVLILPAILTAGGFFADSKQAFAGGWHWQALAAAAVEGALAVSASLWLIAAFRQRFDNRRALMRGLGDAAYGAFLVHPPVIVGLAVAVHALTIAAGLKLAIVLVAGISASFGLASVATRLRPVARVIGAARTPEPPSTQPSVEDGVAPAIV